MKPDNWRFLLCLESDLPKEELVVQLMSALPGSKSIGSEIQFKGHVIDTDANSLYIENLTTRDESKHSENYRYESSIFPITEVDPALQKAVIEEVMAAARQLGFGFLMMAETDTEAFDVVFPELLSKPSEMSGSRL